MHSKTASFFHENIFFKKTRQIQQLFVKGDFKFFLYMMMNSQLVPINFNKVMQTRAYTVFVLGNEEKQFAIYTDPHVGLNIQTHITEKNYPRPLTHDMIDMIFDGFDIKILQIVIDDVQDTVYYARLFIQQQIEDKKQILEIDCRPSDCLTLALMKNIPIFCKKEVLEKVVPLEE